MRKFLIIFAFVIIPLTGYFTVSQITMARAVVCTYGEEPCIAGAEASGALAAGIGTVLLEVVLSDIPQVWATLETYYQGLSQDFAAGMQETMDWTFREITDWFNTFWYYNIQPEMKLMAAQLTLASVEQAFAEGMFADASNLIRTRRALDDMAIEDHREQRPSEKVCTAGSIMSAMTRANVFSDAYQAFGAGDKEWIAANQAQSEAGSGFAAYLANRWESNRANASVYGATTSQGGNFGYEPLWCNAAYNKGFAGCPTDGKLAGQDVDIAGMIFAQDTIPLDLAQDQTPYYTKANVDEMVTNLAEAFGKDPVTAGNAGKDGILDSLSYRAKRQVVYDGLFYVISRRVPGGFRSQSNNRAPINSQEFIDLLTQMRQQTGEDKTTGCGSVQCANPDPSRNEIFRSMITQRFQSGKYALGQIDEPENNQREQVINQALQLIQMSDQMDLMDHWSVLLAAQVGGEIVNRTSFTSGSNGAPLKGTPSQ